MRVNYPNNQIMFGKPISSQDIKRLEEYTKGLKFNRVEQLLRVARNVAFNCDGDIEALNTAWETVSRVAKQENLKGGAEAVLNAIRKMWKIKE